MGEVTPTKPPARGSAVGDAILGGVCGLVLSVILSVLAVTLSGTWSDTSPGACGGGILVGIALLAIAAGFGLLAWYMLFRNPSRTFGAGFLRGLSVVVALYLLIPWPCSYSFTAFMRITSACGHGH